MSCRKFSRPRHGSLQFRPKTRVKRVKQAIRSFPADNKTDECYLTGFIAYKAGMTHVIRAEEIRQKNKIVSKENMDAVTILEAPAMHVIGIAGYQTTLKGLYRNKMLIVEDLGEGVVRRLFERKWIPGIVYSDARKVQGYTDEDIQEIVEQSDSVRLICATQACKIPALRQKKADVIEIQINGGNSIKNKVEFALSKLNGEIRVTDVFAKDEFIDTIGVTKGKGFQGTVKRWGTTILPRKTKGGCRKVACIGAWHPTRVMFSVARAGQLGFHRRTQANIQVYGLGDGNKPIHTDFDLTEKLITPMGGFPSYGIIKNDYLIVKGAVTGPRKRMVTLRKSLHPKKASNISIKFVDTSSKIGAGRFQTSEEKKIFYGVSKTEVNNNL